AVPAPHHWDEHERTTTTTHGDPLRDSSTEPLLALRKHLRGDDEKPARQPADCLARVWMPRLRHRRRSKGKGKEETPRVVGEHERQGALLDSLPEKERERVARAAADIAFYQHFGFWPELPPPGFPKFGTGGPFEPPPGGPPVPRQPHPPANRAGGAPSPAEGRPAELLPQAVEVPQPGGPLVGQEHQQHVPGRGELQTGNRGRQVTRCEHRLEPVPDSPPHPDRPVLPAGRQQGAVRTERDRRHPPRVCRELREFGPVAQPDQPDRPRP